MYRYQYSILWEILSTLNYTSILIGAAYLHAVSAATHIGSIGQQWTAAMNKDKGTPDWWNKKKMRQNQGVHLAVEFVLAIIQTFFVMGMMNLAGVDSTIHALQLGVFFFFSFGLPELYHAWVWEERPCELLRLKFARRLLTTAGLTTLLYNVGSHL